MILNSSVNIFSNDGDLSRTLIYFFVPGLPRNHYWQSRSRSHHPSYFTMELFIELLFRYFLLNGSWKILPYVFHSINGTNTTRKPNLEIFFFTSTELCHGWKYIEEETSIYLHNTNTKLRKYLRADFSDVYTSSSQLPVDVAVLIKRKSGRVLTSVYMHENSILFRRWFQQFLPWMSKSDRNLK